MQLIDATKWYRPLTKNLGKKNCELGPDDIDGICRTFLAFEESEESKIFDNESFGYWKVTVERPLRLRVDLSKERLELFHADCVRARDSTLSDAVHAVALREGAGPHRDFSAFKEAVKRELRARGGRAAVTVKRRRLLEGRLAERDEDAEPVVRKVLPRSAVADPIQGRFQDRGGRRPRVVEYEPDTQLRDTEQVPLVEAGGIEGFLRREVLPYAEDAWYVPKTVKIGYEISFNRYFYKPKPMRTLEEISADIASVEREAEGLLGGLVVRQAAPSPQKLRVYADTSVISGCEDDDFREASRRLVEQCNRGELTLVVSEVMINEIARAPQAVQDVLAAIDTEAQERIQTTDERNRESGRALY